MREGRKRGEEGVKREGRGREGRERGGEGVKIERGEREGRKEEDNKYVYYGNS